MNIVCSTLFGFYGLVLAVILVLFHLGSLKSFGVPYLEPLAGEHFRDYFIDGILRLPLAMIDKRTAHYHVTDTTRAADYTDPVKHVDLQNNREPMSQPQRDRS